MRILHYSLGLPPYRSGGLTKYSHDLMTYQSIKGDMVFLLFPGHYSKNKSTYIKQLNTYKNINVHEVVNPLPVPLLNGTKSPLEFMSPCSKNIFIEFLKSINVSVIHIHTFMGLHIEFLQACKDLRISIVYTTHDYFGLCPKVNFLDTNNILCNTRNSSKCRVCNLSGDSLKKIKILQSKTYRTFKNFGGVKLLKKLPFKSKIKSSNQQTNNLTVINENEMKSLLDYYLEMFKLIDLFLFNSTITQNIYSKYLNAKGKILSITHNHIKDNRKIKDYCHNKLRVSYLGPNKSYKGINLLIDTMNSLHKKGYKDITLNLYGDNNYSFETLGNNIINNGTYNYTSLNEIFNKTDILVVPSICYETYGFIVLEALSYGVPVIVTNKVGSKDLIINSKPKGFIIEDNTWDLENILIKIYKDKSILIKYNEEILNDEFNYLIENHYKDIKLVYRELEYCKSL